MALRTDSVKLFSSLENRSKSAAYGWHSRIESLLGHGRIVIKSLDLRTNKALLCLENITAYRNIRCDTRNDHRRVENTTQDLLAWMVLHLLLPLHFLCDRLCPSAASMRERSQTAFRSSPFECVVQFAEVNRARSCALCTLYTCRLSRRWALQARITYVALLIYRLGERLITRWHEMRGCLKNAKVEQA